MRFLPFLPLAAVLLLPACSRSSGGAAAGVEDAASREAYRQGVIAAEQELREGRPTIYLAGLLQSGCDPETGLPYRSAAGCVWVGSERAFISGHNDTIRSRVRACPGRPPAAQSAATPCTTAPTSSPRNASPSR